VKVSQLFGLRFKETPADCQIASHIYMLRGGYIKNVGNGIFSLYTPAKRVMQKIEAIIREEMNRIDGQEVLFPVSMPASLWKESGRFDSVGNELLRFKDRGGNDMVLGMTHEEAAVHLARDTAASYANYPFMIYQIQTKFRDEPRARGGLIRVREFTMKDGYSFHTSQADLESYYAHCFKAYERIFTRVGLKNFVAVAADSGMMGGKVSHEFMLLTPVGEDSLAICESCDYSSNADIAESVTPTINSCPEAALEKVHTPGMKTIDEVRTFLDLPIERKCKAVVYQSGENGGYIAVFIRGDLEVNETKLQNFLGEEIRPAIITEESGLNPGYLGPYGLNGATVLFDNSLKGIENLCCGANEEDYHYIGFNIERDYGTAEYHDFAKITDGGLCPKCGCASIKLSRGIEIGNIFQLGDKYTKAMDMRYTDETGDNHYPIMGCYGIGIGRLAASVGEEHHDNFGLIWPISIAPWQVHICAIRADNHEVSETANELYRSLADKGIEVIFDDRAVSAGVMFSEADLLGIPIRATVSPKTCSRNIIEISTRDKTFTIDIDTHSSANYIEQLVKDKLNELNKF